MIGKLIRRAFAIVKSAVRSAVATLRNAAVGHRDIKPANLPSAKVAPIASRGWSKDTNEQCISCAKPCTRGQFLCAPCVKAREPTRKRLTKKITQTQPGA